MHCHSAPPEGTQNEKEEKEKNEPVEKKEPLEDWRRNGLAAKCNALSLGLSDHGVKAVLIDKIKKTRAATED